MLKFGMPTLIELPCLEDCAAKCRELGLDFVELNMNLPQYQPGEIDPARCREIAEKYGIFYTIHLDENLNVSDFNPYIAQGYRRTAAEAIELAKGLGVPVLNMHLAKGVYFTLPERKVYLFDQYRERYLASVAAFRTMCQEEIGGAGITVCVENCDGYTDFQKEALELLLGSPVFGLTFDVGHDHGCGGLDEGFIEAHFSRLVHMHLHDALRKKNHLALGAGEIDLAKYLAMAEKRGLRVVLETKTVAGLTRSAEWVRNHRNATNG